MDLRRDPRLTVYEPRSPVRRIGAWTARAPWGRLGGPLLGAVLVGGSFALDWFEGPETEWELGLVAVSRGGEVAFTGWPELQENYRLWVREGRRREAGLCLDIPAEQRERLIAEAPGGRVLAFSGVDLGAAGDAEACGGRGSRTAEIDFDTLGWVPCGVDAFVANRFACPGRPPSRVVSEPPLEGWEHYPLEAGRAGQEGTARVRGTRDRSGTPTACAVLASSGHAALDRQTCRAGRHRPCVHARRNGGAGADRRDDRAECDVAAGGGAALRGGVEGRNRSRRRGSSRRDGLAGADGAGVSE
jgi:TonB family protein